MSVDSGIGILIVDDREFIRDAFKLFIDTQPTFKLAGQAASGEEAIMKCRELHPDVVLIDIMMPGIGGIAAIQQIRARFPEIRIVAITSHETEFSREQILAAGAHEFLIKDTSGDVLANAINEVCRQ